MSLKSLIRPAGCVALVALLASCSKSPEHAPSRMVEPVETQIIEESRAAAAPSMDAAPPPPPPATLSAASTAQQMGSSAATYTDSERKFIRTANARFQVKDVYVAALGIEDTVGGHGGFVVKNDIAAQNLSSQSHSIGDGKLMELSEYKVQGHLIVRVPSARTQDFLRAIVSHVVFLDERNFAARDAQFDMLRQQLEAIRNQETQSDLGEAVRDGGKLTQKTDAIVNRNQVKAARDAALIAKKEFDDQVSFSTIELKLYQPSKVLQTERVDVASIYRKAGPGFFSQLGQQIRGGWEDLLEFCLALAGIWPVLLIAGAIGTVVWRLVRRSRRKKAAAASVAPA